MEGVDSEPPLKKEEYKTLTHYLQRFTTSVLLEELWKTSVVEEAGELLTEEGIAVEDKTFSSETTRIVCVYKLYPAVQERH